MHRGHVTSSKAWEAWDQSQPIFGSLDDGYAQYQQPLQEEERPVVQGIWELATIEANGIIDRFADLLIDEVPRGEITRKEAMCLNTMRATLRYEMIRRRHCEAWMKLLNPAGYERYLKETY